MKIEHLLLDLGGVFYQIDFNIALKAFLMLIPEEKKPPPGADHTWFYHDPVFTEFEKGISSESEFRDSLREKFYMQAENKQIDAAWNSMLQGLYPGSYDLLKKLQDKYTLHLLSNSNSIHYRYLLPKCREFFKLFNSLTFSFEIHSRKPEQDCFAKCVDLTGLDPTRTLFVDDNLNNVRGAENLMKFACHHTENNPPFYLNNAKFMSNFIE